MNPFTLRRKMLEAVGQTASANMPARDATERLTTLGRTRRRSTAFVSVRRHSAALDNPPRIVADNLTDIGKGNEERQGRGSTMSDVSRRSFLKGAAATAGVSGLAALGLFGCAPATNEIGRAHV